MGLLLTFMLGSTGLLPLVGENEATRAGGRNWEGAAATAAAVAVPSVLPATKDRCMLAADDGSGP